MTKNRKKQGSSDITARKEYEIGGLSWMRFTQFGSRWFRYKDLLIADIFCGDGTNAIGGEIIDGSPIKIIRSFNNVASKETSSGERFRSLRKNILFSDIRESAIETCKQVISEIGVAGLNERVTIRYAQMEAAETINAIRKLMKRNPSVYLFLVIDPNGPKQFPRDELIALLNDRGNRRRVDVIVNLSATALNRCIAAKEKCGLQFPWLDAIDGLDSFLVEFLSAGRYGWIRKPDQSDPQRWFMIPTYGIMKPRSDWSKQGYVEIFSSEGKKAREYYSNPKRHKDVI